MQQQCKWWIYLPPVAMPQAVNTMPGHLSTLILLETKFWVFLGIRNIFDKIFYGKKVQIMFVNNGSSILIYFEHITYETKKSFSMTWKLERFKIATKKVFFFLSDKKLFTGIFLNLYVGKVSDFGSLICNPYPIWAKCCMLANQPAQVSLFLVTSSSCRGHSSCTRSMKF